MKNKYERLNKEEKKAAIKEFSNASSQNASVIARFKRLRIIGILGIIYALAMFLLDFFKEKGIFDYGLNVFNNILISYLIDACLLIFCVVFYLKGQALLKETVNRYLIDKNKK